ncbi:MAG TPA: TrbI/VirB10 family protein [Oligoflexia bacterium]|nr:TrbI/VirB10 family protein [Oligoflexia bacterium]
MNSAKNTDCPAADLVHPENRLDLPNPAPNSGFKKRNIALACILLAAFLAWGIIYGILPKRRLTGAQRDTTFTAPKPSDLIQGLPGSYGDLKPKKEKPTQAMPAVLSQPRALSAEEKLMLELRLKRLRQAALARESHVFFKSAKLDGANSSDLSVQQGASLPYAQASPEMPPGEGLNPRENDSRQDEKQAFLNETSSGGTHLREGLIPLRSPYELLAGTLIPALLLSGLNSDLPGKILAQVSQNVFDTAAGRHLLLPQGAKLIGEYDSRIAYGQERVLVVWTRIIFPNGKSISLESMPGIDLSGYAGMSDQVNNHFDKLLTGVVLGSVLGATVQMANGRRSYDPTWGELAAEGAAQNINQAGQQITRKNLNVQPTIEIRPGIRFNVFATKDITLEPYQPK